MPVHGVHARVDWRGQENDTFRETGAVGGVSRPLGPTAVPCRPPLVKQIDARIHRLQARTHLDALWTVLRVAIARCSVLVCPTVRHSPPWMATACEYVWLACRRPERGRGGHPRGTKLKPAFPFLMTPTNNFELTGKATHTLSPPVCTNPSQAASVYNRKIDRRPHSSAFPAAVNPAGPPFRGGPKTTKKG